jgi:hypothetical protein
MILKRYLYREENKRGYNFRYAIEGEDVVD